MELRSADDGDVAGLEAMASRLHDFGPPPWRPREQMDQAVRASLVDAVQSPGEGQVVLIAEEAGMRAGYVHLHPDVDFFTGETHGHVSDLVVAPGAEGRGIGRALMEAAEAWARARGYRLLTLNVFGDNVRARALYDRLGYRPDTTKMVKELR